MKLVSVLFFGLLMFTSCGGDDFSDCTVDQFNDEIAKFNADYNAAIAAFNADNSPENCEAIKKAGQDYIDSIEDFNGCDALDQSQYQSILNSARSAVDAILCN